jgi:hypothetical protein
MEGEPLVRLEMPVALIEGVQPPSEPVSVAAQ